MRWYLGVVFAAVPLVAAVSLTGCSGGSAEMAQVTGEVQLDGKPLENVEVVFVPVAKPGKQVPLAAGVSDATGQVLPKATGATEAGVPVGSHRVLIRDLRAIPQSTWDPNKPDEEPTPTKALPSRVPAVFNQAASTPFQNVEVKPGKQSLVFKIHGRQQTGELVVADGQGS